MDKSPIESHRSWWKLHKDTWIIVCCVLGALILENMVGREYFPKSLGSGNNLRNRTDSAPTPDFLQHGWPMDYAHREKYVEVLRESQDFPRYENSSPLPFGSAKVISFHPIYLVLNILLLLLILVSTAFTTESYLRHQPRWRFSIQTLMVFTVFFSLLMMNINYDLIRWRGNESWEYIPFFIICLGLWCVFWAGWRLIGWGVGRIGRGLKDG